MRIDQYITGLRKRHNIIITVDNDVVKIQTTQGVVDKQIVEEIRSRKMEILTFFKKAVRNKTNTVIPRVEENYFYPVSSAQKRLYLTWELDRESLAYNLPQVVRLLGSVDLLLLNTAFRKLIDRHEILRTSFSIINEMPVQIISPQVDFQIEQLFAGDEQANIVLKKFIQAFDLGKAPLLRVGLIEISALEHILVVDMHHIISDGISQGIIINDFVQLYNNAELPDLHLRYKDYAAW
ncbi:MAG: condensation domain-containing protein, partial [Chitinophagaceae bacterium]